LDPRIKDIIKYGVAFAVLLLAFFGSTYILRGALGTEYPMMVVVSQSMVPTLGVGDYIIVAKIQNTNQIKAGAPPDGEIIVFLKPGTTDEYIVHRAIREIDSNGVVSYVTKGDNNAFADGTPVSASNVMGKVVGHIPIIGYFSLFIKTLRGFGLVIGFMAIAFFIDYILAAKRPAVGRFPPLSLVPLLVAPVIVASYWFLPSKYQLDSGSAHLALDSLSIAVWYVACLLIPLAFNDDDTGVMVWLYHLVLIMVPIACDVTWWTNNITPSQWWYSTGSTVPINWFLMQEQPAFDVVFNSILRSLLPGIVIFVVVLYAKRKGWEPFDSWQRRLRRAPPEPPTEEPQPVPLTTPDASQDSKAEPGPEHSEEPAPNNS
jgi:signal peptidase